jgi:oligoendopeptidase F
MARRLTRAEVPAEQTWNLADIFPTVAAWEAEYSEIPGLVGTVTTFKGRLGEGAKVLLECLDAQEALQKRLAKVAVYASLNIATDGTNPAAQAVSGKAASLSASVQADTSFIQSEALGLPDGALDHYLQEEPGLEPYRVTIEKYRTQTPPAQFRN